MVINDVFQFLFGLVSSKNQMLRDINELKTEMEKISYDLVPFSAEEFTLTSYNVANTSSSRGFYKASMGIFTTIYYEHLFAFNIKRYGERQFSYVVKTDADDFAFIATKDGNVMVYMNQNELGKIVNDSYLYNTRNQLIGTIDLKHSVTKMDIHIKGVSIGYMNKKDETATYLLRAIELTKTPTHDELYIATVLVLYQLILDFLKK